MRNTLTDRRVVVGVFANSTDAQQVVRELLDGGFREDQIGIASPHGTTTDARDLRTEEHAEYRRSQESHADEGAIAGAATGLGVGALWGIGIAAGFLPAIGPAIAGGVLASILTSAAAGAAAGGLVGALVGLGIPEDEAEYYHREFQAGRTIVTVQTEDRVDQVTRMMERFGGRNVHTDHNRAELGTATPTASDVVPTTHTTPGTHGYEVPLTGKPADVRRAPVHEGDTIHHARGRDKLLAERETDTRYTGPSKT